MTTKLTSYPTIEQVEQAGVYDLLGWHRFLPSPTQDEHTDILNRIMERLGEEREKDNAAYVSASKALGWD